MAVGLYIHVPFCRSKCPYCDFYSLAYNKDNADLYVNAVIENCKFYAGQEIDSIYFGGGTPSLLSTYQFEKILKSISDSFVLKDAEITLEANPKTIDKKRLKELKALGFNRISFGAQSLVDNELISLGRIHSAIDAINIIQNAYAAGFNNISADVMLGITQQNKTSLSHTIKKLANLPLTHISAYMLKIEPDTPYNNEKIISALPSEDTVCELYLMMISQLKENGFMQYEISNFSKKGFKCRHNLKYWHCEEYIGIGPSSHSYYNGIRYRVPNDINLFINSTKQTQILTEAHPHTFEETAMLYLRLNEGLPRFVCESFNIDFDMLIKKATPYYKHGFVKLDNDNISLTPTGFLVSNEIIARIIL